MCGVPQSENRAVTVCGGKCFRGDNKNPNIGKASDSNGFNFDEIAEMAKNISTSWFQ